MIDQKNILQALPKVLKTIDIPGLGKKIQGKVRDFYILDGKRVLITADRQSAFNYNIGYVPYKGAVLNQLADFWFEKTKYIVPNHVITVPDPNVTVGYNCEPIPVEMVVRGYLTGSTVTSIWYSYEKGEREIYGLKFPDGMEKNQKLPTPMITPTTHPLAGSGNHDDERLTREEIIKQKIVPKKLYEEMERVTLKLFAYGTKLCKKQGLILVDTKYEFGLHDDKLMLIDEIHTPDSSRFWIADTYKERFKKGLEPENYDKEFLRLWYRNNGYSGVGQPEAMPEELVVKLAKRYISVYEKITGETFKGLDYPIEKRIARNVNAWLHTDKQVELSTGLKVRRAGNESKGGQIGARSTKKQDLESRKSLKYAEIEGLEKKNPFKRGILKMLQPTANLLLKHRIRLIPESLGEPAALLDFLDYDFYLAFKTDGVGTKNLVADAMAKKMKYERGGEKKIVKLYSGLGIDLIASNVNDLICMGARPFALSDEIAAGNFKKFTDKYFIKGLFAGLKKGCLEAGITIPSGESPTLTDIIYKDTVSITGSSLGLIKPRSRVVLGKNIVAGDVIYGLASSGIHTNGLSLARKIVEKLPDGYFTKFGGHNIGEELLTPTRIYVKAIMKMFDEDVDMHYMTHISGSSFKKIMRAKQPFTYVINKLPRKPKILEYLQKIENITDNEAYETWNMGLGFVIFAPDNQKNKIKSICRKYQTGCYELGYVKTGAKQVIIKPLKVSYNG